MPFYEYQCDKCSEIFEFFIRNGDKAPEICEVCGGRLHKIISLSTFHLKGSGWYITDYARKNSPNTDSREKNNNSTSDTKPSTDNASEKKTESLKSS